MAENREVRSDVFSMLMEEKKYALEVYNALNKTDYKNPEDVEIHTLAKGISLSMRNDAAFIVDMNLNIYEHQSTYNPNMPLRALFYLCEVLKPLYVNTDIYKRKLIQIPVPRFVVFYNGMEKRPAVEMLRLSEAFVPHTDAPELELICTVYNINPGYNDELLKRCKVLREYMILVEKVLEYKKNGDAEAIKHAIDYCMENDVLSEFLMKRREEVEKSMTLDMTWEHREQMIRRDERAEGREEGRTMMLVELVNSNKITIEEAVTILGVSEEAFMKVMANT